MYVLRPLKMPAPSLAKMPTRRNLLRIADDGRTPQLLRDAGLKPAERFDDDLPMATIDRHWVVG
jgi:hypothetical protein